MGPDTPGTMIYEVRLMFHLFANLLHDVASAIDPWDRSKR